MVPNVYGAAIQIFDADTNTVVGRSHGTRFILNERVVVGGFYGLPHEWEQSPAAAAADDGQAAQTDVRTAV